MGDDDVGLVLPSGEGEARFADRLFQDLRLDKRAVGRHARPGQRKGGVGFRPERDLAPNQPAARTERPANLAGKATLVANVHRDIEAESRIEGAVRKGYCESAALFE